MRIKIAVTGGYQTGKTTFIETISDPWENSVFGRSLVMDFGQIAVDEQVKLHLFGTPRAQHFGSMLNILDSVHCVVMVDSTRPETFREAKAVMQAVEYFDLPYVVAANFQDCAEAWDVEALRIALRVPRQVAMIPCAAWHRGAVKDVILTLIETTMAAPLARAT